jgi:hypothetical protein
MLPVSPECPFLLPLLENAEGAMKKDIPESLAT